MQRLVIPAFFMIIARASMAEAPQLSDGWEVSTDATTVIVLAPGLEEQDDQAALFELAMRVKAEKVLDNGAEIGMRLNLRVQRDHPGRAGFSGLIRNDFTGPGSMPLRGAFTGLTRAGDPEDAGARGVLETAFIYLDGGYGELSVGRDTGVAARFHTRVPDVFTHDRVGNGYLDPGGLNIIRTRNDLTGPAAKVSYTTPRLLGVRAGISYTPQANVRGLDRDPARAVPGVVRPHIENALELGVQASRRLKDRGVRLTGSLAWSYGNVSSALPGAGYEEVETVSIGARARWEALSLGISALSSNNGLSSNGDYSAWTAGIKTHWRGLDWAVNYGQASDDGTGLKAENWSVGAARKISDTLTITGGWRANSLDVLLNGAGASFIKQNKAADSVVVEITLSY